MGSYSSCIVKYIRNVYLLLFILVIVISEPQIISLPINATVERVGLPITLTCEVSGDPNHYWVGWMHRNSIIQEGDDNSHSLSTLPSLMSPNTTSYHLNVHYVKKSGEYTCQVYSLEGKQLDHVTHSVKGMHMATRKFILTYILNVLFSFRKLF